MKRVITAINNKNIIEKISKNKDLKIIFNNLEYREGILEIIEKIKNIDVIIISELIPGEISIEELIKKIRKVNKKIGNKILALDGIQDPGNLGTIIRSAVAFNIDTIVLGKGTVDLYNSKVIRGTQGMLFHINIISEDLCEFISNCKEQNYKILGTKVTHGKNLKNIEKNDKFVIIMGNEGNGISDSVEDLCDEFIYIDMNEVCESLNVGVATSIILYELDK